MELIIKCATSIFTFIQVVTSAVLLHLLGTSLKPRGFFCDDKSLMYPIRESTVSNTWLTVISLVLPLVIMIITEIMRAADRRVWHKKVYKFYRVFLFGLICNQIITDAAKYLIGRLRPYFFAVCQPVMPGGTTCNDSINLNRLIEEYECTSTVKTSTDFKEIFLSFPSGHASMSFYAMLFVCFYLQYRMSWRGSKLLKHFFQFLFILLAWSITLTRILDYRHHCE